MKECIEELNIRFCFADEVSEEKNYEMWTQFFEAIDLFREFSASQKTNSKLKTSSPVLKKETHG